MIYTGNVVGQNCRKLGKKRTSRVITVGCSILLADGEGFEPPEELPLQRFSRPSHSTALPPIRNCFATRCLGVLCGGSII